MVLQLPGGEELIGAAGLSSTVSTADVLAIKKLLPKVHQPPPPPGINPTTPPPSASLAPQLLTAHSDRRRHHRRCCLPPCCAGQFSCDVKTFREFPHNVHA